VVEEKSPYLVAVARVTIRVAPLQRLQPLHTPRLDFPLLVSMALSGTPCMMPCTTKLPFPPHGSRSSYFASKEECCQSTFASWDNLIKVQACINGSNSAKPPRPPLHQSPYIKAADFNAHDIKAHNFHSK
jgi:hypothetical protein